MKYIVSILLSILIIITPFLVISQFTFTYNFIYSFTGIYDEMPSNLIDSSTKSFIDIIHGNGDMLIKQDGQALFKAQEIYHMYEVRNIFSRLKKIMIFLAIFIIAYIFVKKDYSVFKYQFYFSIFLVLFFGLLSPFFSKAFDIFHRLLFNNDYWMFTSEHYLIKILTLDFFLYFLLIGIFIAFITSTGLFFLERKLR